MTETNCYKFTKDSFFAKLLMKKFIFVDSFDVLMFC